MNKWKKTAKIQKKWDIPKGQPHFLALKIVYQSFLPPHNRDSPESPPCDIMTIAIVSLPHQLSYQHLGLFVL